MHLLRNLTFASIFIGIYACPANADTSTHYSFKPKPVADVSFSGLDLQYTDAGTIVSGSVTCIARGEKGVNKNIHIDFFVFDDSNTGAFYAIKTADKTPVSGTSDAYCGAGGAAIANPHRTPKGMKLKVTNTDTGEFTESDLEIVNNPAPFPCKRKRC